MDIIVSLLGGILAICIMCCCFFMLFDTKYKNINDTPFGYSILNNVYKTTGPTKLEYYHDEKKIYLTNWNIITINPYKHSFQITLPPNIHFIVTDIQSRFNYFSGRNLTVRIMLLDDIPFTDIEKFEEVEHNPNTMLTKLMEKDITKTKNPHLKDLIDKKHKILKTKNYELNLSAYTFFEYNDIDIKNTNPITNKNIITLEENL